MKVIEVKLIDIINSINDDKIRPLIVQQHILYIIIARYLKASTARNEDPILINIWMCSKKRCGGGDLQISYLHFKVKEKS